MATLFSRCRRPKLGLRLIEAHDEAITYAVPKTPIVYLNSVGVYDLSPQSLTCSEAACPWTG
jgi:hypothetical protein